MQLVVFAGAPTGMCCLPREACKARWPRPRRGCVVASDGANRQRVDSDFFAAKLKQPSASVTVTEQVPASSTVMQLVVRRCSTGMCCLPRGVQSSLVPALAEVLSPVTVQTGSG